MLDPDIPPEAEDAIGGVADAGLRIVAVQEAGVTGNKPAECTPRQWITTIDRR